MRKYLVATCSWAIFGMIMTPSAHAVSITIDRFGPGETVIQDNGLGDNDLRSGIVSVSGAFGGYEINQLTAVSAPLFRPSLGAGLQFTTLSINSTVADPDPITFEAAASDLFIPNPGPFPGAGTTGTFNLGGTTTGSVNFALSAIDAQNSPTWDPFLTNFAMGFQGPPESGVISFSDSRFYADVLGSPFSIVTLLDIDHDSLFDVTSLSATTAAVPLPPALPALVIGLAAMGLVARRRRG